MRPVAPRDLPPRQVIEALREQLAPGRLARMEEIAGRRLARLTIVLEDLYDPHNGAAALRSIEALGLQTVHVIERAHPFRFSPKVTQGCERWLEIVRHRDAASCAAALHAQGFLVYGTVPGAATTIAELPCERPLAIAFGNEHAGLSDELRSACDGEVGLGLFGMTRSFNLSVAVALAISDAAARRRGALGRPGDLAPDERERLIADWCFADLRGADAIVRRSVGR